MIEIRIAGIDKNSPLLSEFREDWKSETIKENTRISNSPDSGQLSSLQDFVINLFCGVIDGAALPDSILSRLPAQMELEALVRGRQIALASAFERARK